VGLFAKLQRLGIGGPFYDVIKNMYKNVTSAVKHSRTEVSDHFPISRGVKQGDILSPLLFNIFINDIIPLFHEADSQPPSLVHKTVGCLLYADDLVILSNSPDGLQKSLDKMNLYCDKWKLEINLSKSKVMCLNKQGKYIKHEFTLGNANLQCVKSYSYLGIEISNSCSFKLAQKTLTDKAMRALFKLKGLLYGSGMNPLTSLTLFDQLVKPIALYGSELWGIDLFNTSSLPKFLHSMEKPTCEKLNISLCRFVLGVHKKSQITAIRGELGRAPLAIDIAANVMKYKEYLMSKKEDSLLHEALLSGGNLPETTVSKYWVSQCSQMQQLLTCDTSNTVSDFSDRKSVKQCLGVHYSNLWLEKIRQENKMRTYVKFKASFVPEDYLSIKHEKHRKALTKLRISAHSLAIERGRYTRPLTPVENRTCKNCPGDIENEYHFLIECKQYCQDRENLYNAIKRKCAQFTNLDDEGKFIYMLSAGVDVAELVAKFIYDNLP